MTIALTDWLPDIEQDVSGCSHDSIKRELLHALAEFCQRTRYWQDSVADIPMALATPTYTPVLADETLLSDITLATVQGAPLSVVSRDWLNKYNPSWPEGTGPAPTHCFMHTNRIVRVYPTPNADAVGKLLKLQVALKPSLSATGVEDMLYEEWGEAIAAGAKARLFRQSGKDWTSRNDAIDAQRAFNAAINAATWRVAQGGTAKPLMMQTGGFGSYTH